MKKWGSFLDSLGKVGIKGTRKFFGFFLVILRLDNWVWTFGLVQNFGSFVEFFFEILVNYVSFSHQFVNQIGI